MSESTTPFTRGFRLHLSHGRVLDGAEFPNGKTFVMDDPEWGLGTGARSAELLQIGYPDSRIEWADQAPAAGQPTDLTETPEDAIRRFARRLVAVEQLCAGRPGYHTITVKALLTAMGDADDSQEQSGLPPEQPCTDPRHTGAIREQLGCTGPDPAAEVTG